MIDFVHDSETNILALARLTPEYGAELIIMEFDEAWRKHEDAHKTEPVEISAERFHDMLNVLPLVAWTRDSLGESFKLSERLTGSITSIFVALNGRHFAFDDDIRTPHAECCRRVLQSPAYRDGGTPSRQGAGPAQDGDRGGDR